MLPNFDKVFKVEHDTFYGELAQWRIDFLNRQNINECIYILFSEKRVPRVLCIDIEGVLYIGKGALTENHERIGELINTLNGSSEQHDAGKRYEKIKDKYPICGLNLGVKLTTEPEGEESKYLTQYLNDFGELPPLNRQI